MKTHIWKTSDLVKTFKTFPGVKSVRKVMSGGDYDTENIIVRVNASKDGLYISGYMVDPKTGECKSPSNPAETKISCVALNDGLCSSGGLNSKNYETAKVYIAIRQYFLDLGLDVINHYDEIF